MTHWAIPEIDPGKSEGIPTTELQQETEHTDYREEGGISRRGHSTARRGSRGDGPLATADGRPSQKGWDGAVTGSRGVHEVNLLRDQVRADGEFPAATAADRIARCLERLADGIDAIASHARLMSPPMTVEQVAEYARWKNRSTVYRWVREGRLRPLADKARPLLFDQAEVRRALGQVRGVGS